MSKIQKTISPVDGGVYVERKLADEREIAPALERAQSAQIKWAMTPISERAEICLRFIDGFRAQEQRIIEELAWQMGRPVRFGGGELNGVEERARYMIEIAEPKLADLHAPAAEGFRRFVSRQPLGVVFTIAPWNYPYLTAVNSIIPAIMAGNSVILKHSAQTPLCAERFADAFEFAELPQGVFQYLHLSHEHTERVIQASEINYIAFTGSVSGGAMVEQAAAGRFKGAGLELGGKDPAYVRADADIDHAVENLVDGAYFNSGQSCCGIERIYVHRDLFQSFVDRCAKLINQYHLGNPLEPDTTLGPVVRLKAAQFVKGQVDEAVGQGARALIDPKGFRGYKPDSTYLAPQLLTKVTHDMRVMNEETFGPVVGVMPVDSDQQAIQLMNDSEFGLTASVWTRDEEAGLVIMQQVDTGTCFMNRCDYLDPALAWTGIKNSGRGCTLSEIGYESLTRPKSFHLKTAVSG